jgi:hypothetical protein
MVLQAIQYHPGLQDKLQIFAVWKVMHECIFGTASILRFWILTSHT